MKFKGYPWGAFRRGKQKAAQAETHTAYQSTLFACLPFLTRQACPFSGILFLEKGERMGYNEQGVAKCYCVGGTVSCIGVWEVGASYTLPNLFIYLVVLFYTSFFQNAREFVKFWQGSFQAPIGEAFQNRKRYRRLLAFGFLFAGWGFGGLSRSLPVTQRGDALSVIA